MVFNAFLTVSCCSQEQSMRLGYAEFKPGAIQISVGCRSRFSFAFLDISANFVHLQRVDKLLVRALLV